MDDRAERIARLEHQIEMLRQRRDMRTGQAQDNTDYLIHKFQRRVDQLKSLGQGGYVMT